MTVPLSIRVADSSPVADIGDSQGSVRKWPEAPDVWLFEQIQRASRVLAGWPPQQRVESPLLLPVWQHLTVF